MSTIHRRIGWPWLGAAGLVLGLMATLLAGTPAHAGGASAPGNLRVEWRVVSSAQARERQAAVEAGGVRLSTLDAREQQDTVHSLLVLNGGKARLYAGRTVQQTTWQFLFSAPGANASGSAGATAATGAASAANAAGGSAQLLSQTVWIDLGQGLTVRPRWRGGHAPVELELDAQSRQPVGGPLGPQGFAPDGQIQRQEVSTTLAVPLGQWVVVAQSGRNQTRSVRGTVSTSDLDDQGDAQLEVRVTQP